MAAGAFPESVTLSWRGGGGVGGCQGDIIRVVNPPNIDYRSAG